MTQEKHPTVPLEFERRHDKESKFRGQALLGSLSLRRSVRDFSSDDGPDHELILRWQGDDSYISARIDLPARTFVVETEQRTITHWDQF